MEIQPLAGLLADSTFVCLEVPLVFVIIYAMCIFIRNFGRNNVDFAPDLISLCVL